MGEIDMGFSFFLSVALSSVQEGLLASSLSEGKSAPFFFSV